MSRLSPIRWKTGSSRKPSGTNSAQPSIPPPNETLSSTMNEKTTRLCTFISGVRPRAAPRAMPAATCPGVPSECSVLMIDCISLSRANMTQVSSTAYATDPPSASGAQVRRCVAGRLRRRPPRRRHHPPPRPRAHRRGRLCDGGDDRRAPWRGPAGRRRRVAHRRVPHRAAPEPPRRGGPGAPARGPGPRGRARLHQRRVRGARGPGAGTAAPARAHPAHHRLPRRPAASG